MPSFEKVPENVGHEKMTEKGSPCILYHIPVHVCEKMTEIYVKK